MSKTELTEKSIQSALKKGLLSNSSKKYEMTNLYVYGWESDYLAITKSGYAYECEIKISRSDFKNDRKKQRKYLVLEGKKANKIGPNYFYYAVPENMITVEEIPDYAGLIYIKKYHNSDFYFTEIIKAAPAIHKQKFDFEKNKLVDKFYYNYQSWKDKYEEIINEEDKKRIKVLEKDLKWYDDELSKLSDMKWKYGLKNVDTYLPENIILGLKEEKDNIERIQVLTYTNKGFCVSYRSRITKEHRVLLDTIPNNCDKALINEEDNSTYLIQKHKGPWFWEVENLNSFMPEELQVKVISWMRLPEITED